MTYRDSLMDMGSLLGTMLGTTRKYVKDPQCPLLSAGPSIRLSLTVAHMMTPFMGHREHALRHVHVYNQNPEPRALCISETV